MHAIRQYEFGPPETLRYEEVPDPIPAAEQVRIRVLAAGVHLVDTTIRAGASGGPFALPALPMTPGREVAGVVDQVGAEVDRNWLGARVVAHLGAASGGYAEQAVAAASSLHRVPDHVELPAAVATIGTGRTTMGILELAELSSADVLLVTAAAGGIGTLLVQAGRNAGATVVALAGGPDKVAAAKANGADIVADYTTPDWAEEVRVALGERTVTVALDGVGGTAGRAAFDLLGPGGRLWVFGWSAGEPVRFDSAELFDSGRSAGIVVGPRMLNRPGGLRGLEEAALAELAAGRLTPTLTKFGLNDAATAHQALAGRATLGKVVLMP